MAKPDFCHQQTISESKPQILCLRIEARGRVLRNGIDEALIRWWLGVDTEKRFGWVCWPFFFCGEGRRCLGFDRTKRCWFILNILFCWYPLDMVLMLLWCKLWWRGPGVYCWEMMIWNDSMFGSTESVGKATSCHEWNPVHPGRLTWNIIMGVGKMIFLSKWVIYRFHVNLPGCIWAMSSQFVC